MESAFNTFSFSDQNSNPFQFKDLSPDVKKYVSQVYLVLTGTVFAACIGTFLNIGFGIGGMGTGFLGFLLILYIAFSPKSSTYRLPALLGFGLLEGMSLGPLVELVASIDPSIVLTALVATIGIFVSFSLAAFYADKRMFMYLGAGLGSCLMFLLLGSILSFFGIGREFFFNLNLYLGLLVFMGYVVYDTQLMIFRAERGSKDQVRDALQLFIDFVAIFVRILIIMSKDKKKE